MSGAAETPPEPMVEVVRSGVVESVHAGDVAVVDASGEVVARVGDPHRLVFARSAMKPVQAAVSVSLADRGFEDTEVAVMAASHNAEPVHVREVRSLLARAGVDESLLQCPPVHPRDRAARAADPEARRIYSNCSGKHGGMLAASRAQGWPLGTYRDPGHPLQREVLRMVEEVTGERHVRIGVDGCGVPVHAVPLAAMARIYVWLSQSSRWGERGGAVDRVRGAMQMHPYLVAGRDRVDTAVMQARPHTMVKGGAEGLVCAAVEDRGIGVALKVRDGGSRAVAPALVRVLEELGAMDGGAVERLAAYAAPPFEAAGKRVGQLRAVFDIR